MSTGSAGRGCFRVSSVFTLLNNKQSSLINYVNQDINFLSIQPLCRPDTQYYTLAKTLESSPIPYCQVNRLVPLLSDNGHADIILPLICPILVSLFSSHSLQSLFLSNSHPSLSLSPIPISPWPLTCSWGVYRCSIDSPWLAAPWSSIVLLYRRG